MTGTHDPAAHLADTGNNRERANAEPEARDLEDPRAVWRSGETVPDRPRRPADGPPGRVADAGDIGSGTPDPYEDAIQADAVVTANPPPEVETPARPLADQRQEAGDKLTRDDRSPDNRRDRG